MEELMPISQTNILMDTLYFFFTINFCARSLEPRNSLKSLSMRKSIHVSSWSTSTKRSICEKSLDITYKVELICFYWKQRMNHLDTNMLYREKKIKNYYPNSKRIKIFHQYVIYYQTFNYSSLYKRYIEQWAWIFYNLSLSVRREKL